MIQIANKITALFLLLLCGAVSANEQLLLVTADDMNRSAATLQRFERHGAQWQRYGAPVAVNLGRNGLGWGLGTAELPRSDRDPVKQEGDGRAPAGIFALGPVFGYAPDADTAMPYLHSGRDLICVDDSRSPAYNRLVPAGPQTPVRSFEWMRRDDTLYRIGVVVRHNSTQLPGRGSCIFLHIERTPGAATSGCTSMPENVLREIITWLDPAKEPLLVQIPRRSIPDVARRFRGVGE